MRNSNVKTTEVEITEMVTRGRRQWWVHVGSCGFKEVASGAVLCDSAVLNLDCGGGYVMA